MANEKSQPERTRNCSYKWPQWVPPIDRKFERTGDRLDVSIVIPVYYNELELENTIRTLKEEVIERDPELRFEVIFIDDGSGDNSFNVLKEIKAEGSDFIRIIKFTRNFGQASALQAGFVHSRGDYVVVISADGQDPPGLINQMLAAHFLEGKDVVICVRENREESRYRILTSRFFYWIIKKLSFPDIPLGGFDFVSMSRRALFHAFLETHETHPFFQGQILYTGFKPKKILYTRQARAGGGKSRWTFGKKLTYLIDGALSYSYVPVRVMALCGFIFSILGFLYAGVIFVAKLFGGVPIQGWAPLMIIILIIGGIQMIMIGIIGEYLWRALAQARNRAAYIIDTIIE